MNDTDLSEDSEMAEPDMDTVTQVVSECIRLENEAERRQSETIEAPAWLFSKMLRVLDGVAFQQLCNTLADMDPVADED